MVIVMCMVCININKDNIMIVILIMCNNINDNV